MWPFTTITYCNSGKQIGVWFCQFEHVTFEFFSPPWRGASAMVRRHRCRARWESQPGATKSSQSLTNKSDEPTKDKDGHARTGCSKISKYNIVYIYIHIFIMNHLTDLWFSWQFSSRFMKFCSEQTAAFQSQIPRNGLGGFGAKCSQCPEPRQQSCHDRWCKEHPPWK